MCKIIESYEQVKSFTLGRTIFNENKYSTFKRIIKHKINSFFKKI